MPLGSYIEQTGRPIAIHRNEHQRHLWLEKEEKSAWGHYGWVTGHLILFHDTTILYKSSSYGTRIIKESLEIQLREGVINKKDGARLSMA